jgi:membrane-associated phospholipid phosphatase
MRAFAYQLSSNFINSFTARNAVLHLVAILLTWLIVMSGFDWWYFSVVHASTISVYLWPAVALGGLVPILSPLVLLVRGWSQKNLRLQNTGYALAQSAFLGLFISSTYKAFTGRIPPMHHMLAAATDISHGFQFGFLRGGVFWGWPSSHTTVAFATMVTLALLYPEKKFLRASALLYALYVGFGVSMGIHWFSEFIAGALMGTAIGIAVGGAFLKRLKFHE